MLVVTTPNVPGREIAETLGLVSGDAILGANMLMVSANGTAVRLR
jgi:uncharacterized protein YbjQ (UPF0145 family)